MPRDLNACLLRTIQIIIGYDVTVTNMMWYIALGHHGDEGSKLQSRLHFSNNRVLDILVKDLNEYLEFSDAVRHIISMACQLST